MASCSPTTAPDRRSAPTERELDRLSERIRAAAQKRGHTATAAAHYETWGFRFVAWCLHVPPYDVHESRLGDFWTALTQRQVPQWKVSKAMEAITFFFDHLPNVASRPWAAPSRPSSNTGAPSFRSPLPDGLLSGDVDARSTVPTQPSTRPNEATESSGRRSGARSQKSSPFSNRTPPVARSTT